MKEPKNKLSVFSASSLKVIRDRVGTATIFDETYFEDDGLCDFKNNQFRFWVFTRRFILKVTKSGVPRVNIKRDVVEIEGKTQKEMTNKLDKFVDKLYQVPKDASRDWLPDEVLELKAAVKSGALKV